MIVINDNFAPNGFLDSINSGDCVIRAISYVFNMPYEEVCQKFNIKYNDFLECADPNSINENPISFLKIKNAGFNFRKHEQFKGNFF